MASFATEGEGVADLFAQPNFWRSSKLFDSPTPLEKDFFSLVVKRDAVKSITDEVAVRDEGYFKLPSGLDCVFKIECPSAELPGNLDDEPLTTRVPEADEDPWLFHDEISTKLPEFKTWDSFDLPRANTRPAVFLTEAGASAYDSFLASKSNPCGIKSHDNYKTLDPRGYFASLLALSLGRESVLFSWNQEEKAFMSALSLAKVPGYSGESLSGMLQVCSSCGEACRHLRLFIDETYSTTATPSRIALANALDRLLLVAQDELGVRGLKTRSILQLQSLVRPASALLCYFRRLVSKIKRSTNDCDLLSLIYNEAQSAELSEPFLRDTMGEVLRMVSKPWTDLVEEWIGLKQEESLRISKDGAGKGFIKVETNMWIDDQGYELAEPDYFLDSDNMPTFVTDDVAQTIFETGRNLRFLQANHPQHPLSSTSIITSIQAPKLEWQYDWESITRVEEKALDYQRAVFESLQKSRAAHDEDVQDLRVRSLENDAVLQFFGKDGSQLQETVLASIAHLDRPLEKTDTRDKLSMMLRRHLFSDRHIDQTTGTEFHPHWSLLPLLSFGPIVHAQARLVNRECLRLLFSEHGLRRHLRLQRAFQLLGNGMFSSRLSNALFNPDLETTERRAGVARSGGVMGLRLASRENWPPASSELRLALMGVLTESYQQEHGADGAKTTPSTSSIDELPGDMSFAIRDLSPEEMEKCMNTDSLEALDFLRISYKPPQALLPILTPAILVKYDRIFKLLLRVLRMLFVVDQLFRDISSRSTKWADPQNVSFRFRIEVHHFVSNVARYFFDTGIEQPWRRFEAWLNKIEKGLEERDGTDQPSIVSPGRLGEQHERTLDEIMTALFLRKRQVPVLGLLEEIFTLILQFAKESRLSAEGADRYVQVVKELYRAFREKIEVFITVCRGMTEKSGYGRRHDGETGERAEENSIVMLLLLMDMSNYYMKR